MFQKTAVALRAYTKFIDILPHAKEGVGGFMIITLDDSLRIENNSQISVLLSQGSLSSNVNG